MRRAALLGLALMLCAVSAVAAPRSLRRGMGVPVTTVAGPVVVLDAQGLGVGPLRRQLLRVLSNRAMVVPGQLPLRPSEDDAAAVARERGALAVVTARIDKAKRPHILVAVYDGSDGHVLEEVKWRALTPKLMKGLPPGGLLRVDKAMRVARAPTRRPTAPPPPVQEEARPPPASAPVTTPVEPASPPPSRPHREAPKEAERSVPVEGQEQPAEPVSRKADLKRVPALTVWLGGMGFGRRLRFVDDLFGTLSGYQLNVGPAVVLGAEWYPGAHVTDGWASNLGVLMNGELAVGIRSVSHPNPADLTQVARFSTSANAFRGGVVGRVPLGIAQLGLNVTYGVRRFGVEPATPDVVRPNLPNVSYGSVREGITARLTTRGGSWVGLEAGLHQLMGTGDLGSAAFFPRLGGGAVDGSLGGTWMIGGPIGLRLDLDYTRYFFSFNPQPGDLQVAGGALDEFYGATLSLVLAIR